MPTSKFTINRLHNALAAKLQQNVLDIEPNSETAHDIVVKKYYSVQDFI